MNKIGRKGVITLHIILQVLVVIVMVAEVMNRNFYNVFLCLITLLLFNIPKFVDQRLNIKLPSALETVILLFIYSAEILGEIQDFYSIFPYWDTMLHTINGFIMAAIGFAMIDILNQDPRFHINMSPFFVAFVAFCFSMTIGVFWEFFEFGMDQIFGMDMQKDFIVNNINSSILSSPSVNSNVNISGITSSVINNTDGQYVIEGGYLDIGIIDTMKDLMVNCIGAFVFSVIGIIYIKRRGKGMVAQSFIPQMKTSEEIEQTKKEIDQSKNRMRRNNNEKNKSIVGISNDDDNDNNSDISTSC